MNRLLYQLASCGDISWLSLHFAEFIASHSQTSIDEPLCLSAAMLCEANQQGSVCIDLAELGGRPMFSSTVIDPAQIPRAPQASAWRDQIVANDFVGKPGDQAPITLDGKRLYLNRFWHYEDFVANKIHALLANTASTGSAAADKKLERVFADQAGIDVDQKQAVSIAANNRFSVISGGPGSGKTTTVVRILALLLTLDPDNRIALAAPTGKAAARMMDSIRQRLNQLDLDAAIKSSIPTEATTVHRLLAYRHQGFDFNQTHRLPFDCVIIDEASMVDLKLMYHLLEALSEHSRLILLGDRDQLASVAAGNVLGDITGHGQDMQSVASGITACIALLRSNYRFDSQTAIGELADFVNRGLADSALDLLAQNQRGLRWLREPSDKLDAQALAWLLGAYQPIFTCATPGEALDHYQNTRVLCATNQGPLGVDALNREISETLLKRNNLPEAEFYHGLPIMINRNQHELGLYNGDTGILWRRDQELRAFFRHGNDGTRDFAVNRLPDFSPAWASTVHKSQGSEFDSVLLILPSDPDSEVLCRELLYTAVTRARRQFLLQGTSAVVGHTINKLTQRHSGLAQKLGWPN
ncbi:MAG: exodeoxyribonuclease V subunit alpha [Gammaproteobacteria bacterium]|nr:MAG: exodeoxyribonuclease V subunit alpha [Gammaproteobacteria bacterium]